MTAANRTARVLLVITATYLHASIAAAQTGSMRVTVPSPTAASLGKFGDVPVNLYTGVPDISVPLFTVEGRTLELPITLRYHASGIKVEEKAGRAGLGWVLDAGGTITRTVRGVVDESSNGYYNLGHTFYNDSVWLDPHINTIRDIKDGLLDSEPDRFFFSFAGRSGQFVMGPTDLGSGVEYRSIPHQKLEFEPTISGNAITEWKITTEDGTRYTFGAADTTIDRSTNSSTLIADNFGERHTSSWHLTEIRSPGGDVINLHYSTYEVRHRQGDYRERFDQVVSSGTCVPGDFFVTGEYEITVQKLDSITAAAHTVEFTSDLRSDALSPSAQPQEYRLDRITVTTPSGTPIRGFDFEHSYFPGNRLRLDAVYEVAANGDSLPPYTFTYNSQTLPADSSADLDHWGYYNAENNNTPIPQMMGLGGLPLSGGDRSPDPSAMKAGSLERITYPTGGHTEFTFEANDYGGIGGNAAMPIGEAQEQLATAVSHSGDGVVTTPFTIGGTETVIVTVSVEKDPPDCDEPFGCPFAEIVEYDLFSNGIHLIALEPGNYTLQASDNASGGSALITVRWEEQAPVKKKAAGGLRIAETRTADAMGNITVRRYQYRLQSDTARSSGVINAEPEYGFPFSSSTCSYFSRSSISKMPLGEGPVVGYREVTVLHGAAGEYGKTLYTFRTVADAADEVPPSSFWPYGPRTSYEWKRGQQTSVTEYNASDQVQRHVASTYTFRDTLTSSVTTRRFRGMSVHAFSAGLFGTAYAHDAFEVISAWAHPEADTTIVYTRVGGNPFSTVETYTYGNPEHLQPTEIVETGSNGVQRITRMKYAADYATGAGDPEAAALTAMKGSAHMHSPVIERWVSQKVGPTEEVVQAELTTFKAYGTGRYLPYQRFVLDAVSGVSSFAPSAVSGGFTKDSRYLRQETANSYDPHGRIAQHVDARGKVTNYAYGGNPKAAFLTQIKRAKDGTGTIDLVTDLAYDTKGNLASINDEAGTDRSFTYDGHGRLRQIKNDGGQVLKAYGYTYSRTAGNGWMYQPTNPNAVLDTTYLQHSPTVERIVRGEYFDGLGRSIQTVVKDGSSYHVSAQEYDAMGREWRDWKPYTRTSSGYDPNFEVNAKDFYENYDSISNAKPYVETLYTPDALNRPRRINPEYTGSTPPVFRSFGYGNSAPNKWTVTVERDESAKVKRTFRDVFGNERRIILGYGSTEATSTNLFTDVLGRRTKVTDPRGLITTYEWNTRSLLQEKNSPDAGTTRHKYDRAGDLRYTQYANDPSVVEFTTYDFAGRPLISGRGAATFNTLDPDAASPPTLETDPDNWVIVRKYDAKPANVFPWNVFWTEIDTLTLNHVAGRLAAVGRRMSDAAMVELYSYDADGRVEKRYSFAYDEPSGQIITVVNSAITYTRDLGGEIRERAVMAGPDSFNQWYDYDARGLLEKVFASTSATKPSAFDVAYTYRPSGELATQQFKGGPVVPMRYTIREQLERIGDPATSTYPFSARYAYEANGTISESEFRNTGSAAAQKRYRYVYGHDALNRLKSADFSSWSGSSWTNTLAHDLTGIGYDDGGNVTALKRHRENGTLIDDLTYSYASGSNRLSAVSDAVAPTSEDWDAEDGSFTYDASGNLLTAPDPISIQESIYDFRHELIGAILADSSEEYYKYDHEGWRVGRFASNNTHLYLREGPAVLGEFRLDWAAGQVIKDFFIVVGDRVVGRQPETGGRLYYYTDLLGSTRTVVEGTTVVQQGFDYDPWGVLMPGRTQPGGLATKQGFTGKERDAGTGLDYFGARYYASALGRWTAPDPVSDSFPSWSPYNYVLNNPVGLRDSDGRCPALITGRPCSGALATAVGFVPVLGDAVDILGAVAGHDLLTGETIGSVGIAATVVGTVVGSGRLGRQAADKIGDAVSGSRRAFNNIRILSERKLKGNTIAIDLEMGGSQAAKVQVHLNREKIFVNSLDEALRILPSKLRKNDFVRDQLRKAFERAEKIGGGQ